MREMQLQAALDEMATNPIELCEPESITPDLKDGACSSQKELQVHQLSD